ncbi:MAG: hypothetical protein IH795_00815 [Bacteroidetes bacterium]|nr:hypothetical protein [Bacteroidota bacterium]
MLIILSKLTLFLYLYLNRKVRASDISRTKIKGVRSFVKVAPTLFVLYAQPSIFTFGSMLIVWIIALGVIFGVPALRNDRSE